MSFTIYILCFFYDPPRICDDRCTCLSTCFSSYYTRMMTYSVFFYMFLPKCCTVFFVCVCAQMFKAEHSVVLNSHFSLFSLPLRYMVKKQMDSKPLLHAQKAISSKQKTFGKLKFYILGNSDIYILCIPCFIGWTCTLFVYA